MAVHQLLVPLLSRSAVQNKLFHLVGLCSRKNTSITWFLRKWLPCTWYYSAWNAPCSRIPSWTDASWYWGRFSKMIIQLKKLKRVFENLWKQFMNIHWENIKDGFKSEYKLLKADQWLNQGRDPKTETLVRADLQILSWRSVDSWIKASSMITTLLCIIFH